MSSIPSLNQEVLIDMITYVHVPTGLVDDKLLKCYWFLTRYKDVNLRGGTKLNRVAFKFNPKPLPILSTSRPPNQVLHVLPRGMSNFLTRIVPCEKLIEKNDIA